MLMHVALAWPAELLVHPSPLPGLQHGNSRTSHALLVTAGTPAARSALQRKLNNPPCYFTACISPAMALAVRSRLLPASYASTTFAPYPELVRAANFVKRPHRDAVLTTYALMAEIWQLPILTRCNASAAALRLQFWRDMLLQCSTQAASGAATGAHPLMSALQSLAAERPAACEHLLQAVEAKAAMWEHTMPQPATIDALQTAAAECGGPFVAAALASHGLNTRHEGVGQVAMRVGAAVDLLHNLTRARVLAGGEAIVLPVEMIDTLECSEQQYMRWVNAVPAAADATASSEPLPDLDEGFRYLASVAVDALQAAEQARQSLPPECQSDVISGCSVAGVARFWANDATARGWQAVVSSTHTAPGFRLLWPLIRQALTNRLA